MTQQEQNDAKIPSSKGIMQWVREILHLKAPEMETLPPVPPSEVVTSLIDKATGTPAPQSESGAEKTEAPETEAESKEDTEAPEAEADKTEADAPEADAGSKEKTSCPYALKRNIVESLAEIRRFAEENHLAATMVRALLSLLAEMALGALKGKVSATVLDALLKAFSYERRIEELRQSHNLEKEETCRRFNLEKEEAKRNFDLEKEEAYRLGEIAGRNARIATEEFPAPEPVETVPRLKANVAPTSAPTPEIFTLAREA